MKKVFNRPRHIYQWLLTAALATMLFLAVSGMDAFADINNGDQGEVAPVTITYEDGTTETWDGTSNKTITYPCTVTINRDYAQTKTLKFEEQKVTINGGNHTVTVECNNQFSKSFEFYGTQAVINDLMLNCTAHHTVTNLNITNVAIYTAGGSDVTLQDVTINMDVSSVFGVTYDTAAIIEQGQNDKVTINDSTISATGCRALRITYRAEATVENSIITSAWRDAVCVEFHGTLNMKSGTIALREGYSSTTYYAAVVSVGHMNLYGGEIVADVQESNSSHVKVYGIENGYSDPTNIYGGSIKALNAVVNNAHEPRHSGGLHIYDGILENISETNTDPIIQGGTIIMSGGSLIGNNYTQGYFASTDDSSCSAYISGGSMSNGRLNVTTDLKLSLSNAADVGESNVVYLESGATIAVNQNIEKLVYVDTADTVGKIRVTRGSTDQDIANKIRAYKDGYLVGYDNNSDHSSDYAYVYLYQHEHDWKYTATDNEITVVCVSEDDGEKYCPYTADAQSKTKKLHWTLEAKNALWDGDTYEGASYTEPLLDYEDEPWSNGKLLYTGRGDTEYTETESAPSELGNYTVTYAFTATDGETYRLTRDFTIKKVDFTSIEIKADLSRVDLEEAPTSIMVGLRDENGDYVEAKTLNADNGWSCSFEKLDPDVYKNYSVYITKVSPWNYEKRIIIRGTPQRGYTVYVGVDADFEPSEPSDNIDKQTTAVREKTAELKSCQHYYEWETYKVATATTDGIMRYRCKYCGTVEYEVPTAAYYVFNKETQESIQKAAPNATVTVSTPIFISFHEMVKDAMIARPDVTLVVDYKNAGEEYEMTIPAGSGEMLDTLFGDSRFAGFLYLGGAFQTIAR